MKEKGKGEDEEKEPSAADKANDMRKELEKSHNREFTDYSKYDLVLPSRPEGAGATYAEHEWSIGKIGKVEYV